RLPVVAWWVGSFVFSLPASEWGALQLDFDRTDRNGNAGLNFFLIRRGQLTGTGIDHLAAPLGALALVADAAAAAEFRRESGRFGHFQQGFAAISLELDPGFGKRHLGLTLRRIQADPHIGRAKAFADNRAG